MVKQHISGDNKYALVTDGLWRKSLSAIRSLGKAGYSVAVMGDSLFTTGFWSKYAKWNFKSATATQHLDSFAQSLLHTVKTLASKHGKPIVLLPMEDPTLMWVAEHREALEPYAKVLLPETKYLYMAQSKAETIKAAQSLGLPCPKTEFVAHVSQTDEVLALFAGQEFVIKPTSGSGSAGILYSDQLDRFNVQAHFNQYGPFLIQERIPNTGRGLGVSLLMGSEGECLASFAHERLQEYPNSGGPSTDRKSIGAPELVKMSIQLVRSLHWKGIAMVEWKYDSRDKTPKLMEINPRFWGSLELAVRAGVDFPDLYARACNNELVEPVHDYHLGVRCRWMIPGEILRYLTQDKGERESLRCFLKGFLSDSEEWDKQDIRGWLASWICVGASALNPKYWKYVQRG